jgi:uncharacterized protein YceH (UPF0502 family)
MEPRDPEQLSQADQDEHAEQLADRLSEQYRGAAEGTSPGQMDPLHARIEARIEALEIRITQLESRVSTEHESPRPETDDE